MNNNTLSIQKRARIECVWVETRNPARPLACKWVEGSKAKAMTSASPTTDQGGMRLCA